MSQQPPSEPEPWLRGALSGVHPIIAPVFHSFQQVREDLAKHTAGLSSEQTWRSVARSSLGFHLKHIAGSVDRLGTYLSGGEISAVQLEFLRHEADPSGSLPDLLAQVDRSLAACEDLLRQVSPNSLTEPRYVGRRALPTSVVGLIVHLAEHTQRHLGQAVLIANIVRQSS